MVQKGYTLTLPIQQGRRESVSDKIKQIKNNNGFNFSDTPENGNDDKTIKCSILTIPEQDWGKKKLPAMFVIVTSYTGKLKPYLDDFVSKNLDSLQELLSFCELKGKAINSVSDVVKILLKEKKRDTFYTGQQFLTKSDMLFEENLFNHLQEYLDKNYSGLKDESPKDIFKKLQVEANEFAAKCEVKLEPIREPKLAKLGVYPIVNLLLILFILFGIPGLIQWLNSGGISYLEAFCIVFWVFLGLIFFLATALSIAEYFLRHKDKEPTDAHIRETYKSQQNDVLNEFTLAGSVKPGYLRVIGNYIMLRVANSVKFTLTIPTVFNARWVGLNNYKRFTFFSNFSNQTEGYARDFIDSTPRAKKINLIYGNANGYPKTRLLMLNGAIDQPIPFVKTIYYHQHITEFWYAPLKHLSIDHVKTHHAVRQGIAKGLADDKIENWLNYFGGWKKYKEHDEFRPPQRAEEKLMVDDIQSMVASGHKKLTKAYYVLCKVVDATVAKSYLRSLTDRITTVAEKEPETALNISFTFCGIQKLTSLSDECDYRDVDIDRWTKTFPREFREGMSDGLRSNFLGDLGHNGSDKWDFGKERGEFDFMLIIMAKGENADEKYKREKKAFLASGIIEVGEPKVGEFLEDYKEHFGFVDGISNPRIEGIHKRAANANQVMLKPGEFVLGYKNEYDSYSVSPKIPYNKDVSAKLNQITSNAKDYFVEDDNFNFGKNGTFMVYRQMSQDVEKFWQYQERQEGNGSSNAIKLASKMIGRWPNGSPLSKEKYREAPSDGAMNNENDFLYYENDLDGKGCPYGAHIRRANPRDWLVTEEKSSWATEMVRKKLMLRRGRVYGPPVVKSMKTDEIISAVREKQNDNLHKERGLHFIALVSNINRQFEFVQNTWFQSRAFAGLKNEVDPIIGVKNGIEGRNDAEGFSCPASPIRKRYDGLQNFTQLKGGAYLFLPGLTALKYLCDYDKKDERLPLEKQKEIDRILTLVKNSVIDSDRRKFKRFHVKGYGLQKAKVKISENLPQGFSSTLFKSGEIFDAVVRFSDASHNTLSDNKSGVRGLALKLLDTHLETLDKTDGFKEHTHDFLFTSRPMVHPGTLKAFRFGMMGLFGKGLKRIIGSLNTIITDFPSFFKGISYRGKHHNLLELEYNSATPFGGGEAIALKWILKPLKTPTNKPNKLTETVLKDNLIADLTENEVRFRFGFQRSTDLVKEPIDNSAVVWESDFEQIGELILPKQYFFSDENAVKSDQMNFNVWNVIRDHKPLGDINLARRLVYKEMVKLRKPE